MLLLMTFFVYAAIGMALFYNVADLRSAPCAAAAKRLFIAAAALRMRLIRAPPESLWRQRLHRRCTRCVAERFGSLWGMAPL